MSGADLVVVPMEVKNVMRAQRHGRPSLAMFGDTGQHTAKVLPVPQAPLSGASAKPVKEREGESRLSMSFQVVETKDHMEEGVVIRGPVAHEMVVLFIMMIPILTIGNEWGVTGVHAVRHAIFLPYLLVSWLVYQVSRLIYYRNPLSLWPFYLSIIPAVLMTMLSREMHMLIAILWYSCMMTIQMQSGVQSRQQVALSTCVYIVCYLLTILFMTKFYVDEDGKASFAGIILDPAIEWKQEVLIIFCIILVGCAFYMLLVYIKRYAEAVGEKARQVEEVKKHNEDLKEQIEMLIMEQDEDVRVVDTDSPLARVVDTLRDMQDSGALPADMSHRLGVVIKVLVSNQSATDFVLADNNDSMDDQTNVWLRDMLQVKPQIHDDASVHSESTLDVGGKARKKGASMKKHSMHNVEEEGVVSRLMSKPGVEAAISKVSSLTFNVFDLGKLTDNCPLLVTGFHLFEQHNLLEIFEIPEEKLVKFLRTVEDGYWKTNPYHNSAHAADVAQFINYMMQLPLIRDSMGALDNMAMLVACIVHDYDHPGKNNAFLVNVRDKLAINYNDRSVLENHHASATFRILQDEENNIFCNLTPNQYTQVRAAIVTNVLATDAAMHFDNLGKFKAKTTAGDFDFDKDADRQMVMAMCTKCSDMNNPSRPEALSSEWTRLIMEEFFIQGDTEKELDLPVSMFMDRYSTDIPKCQLGFIDFIVRPMFDAMNAFIPIPEIMHNIELNRRKWASKVEGNGKGGTPLVTRKRSIVRPVSKS